MAVFEELTNASEFEEQISNLQGQIDSLDETYATDTDIQGLQGQIDTLEETVAGLGSGGGGASIKLNVLTVPTMRSFIENNYHKIVAIYHDLYFNMTMNRVKITSDGTTFDTYTTSLQGPRMLFRITKIYNGYIELQSNNGGLELRLSYSAYNGTWTLYAKNFETDGSTVTITSGSLAYTSGNFTFAYIE